MPTIIDFNGMSTHLGLFYAEKWVNCIHCMFIYPRGFFLGWVDLDDITYVMNNF